MSDAIMSAAKCYNERQRLPNGKSSYWGILADVDKPLSCCDKIKGDRASHCWTAIHIATMFGVNRKEVLRTARQLRVLEALEQA